MNPAPLAISADNKTRLPNTANPPFTATYTGFKLGETPAVLTGTLVFDTTATQSSPTGSYPIVPSGQISTNYAITYFNGTLTVARPASALDFLTNALYAELQRLGLNDYSNEVVECIGQGSGGSASGALGGVAAQSRHHCKGKSSAVAINRPAPKIVPGMKGGTPPAVIGQGD